MAIRRILFSTSLVPLLAVGCAEQDDTNAPPVTTSAGGAPTTGLTTAGGSGGSGDGTGSATTGGPSCTVDCPDDETGICPGHAEWTRGIAVFGLWQSNNSGNFSVAPSAGDEDEPRCAQNIGLCVEYDDPAEVQASGANLLADQRDACAALTLAELNALGLDDISVGSGWTLVHHWCVTENNASVTYNDQTFTLSDTSVDTCATGEWKHEGSCSAADCPTSGGAGSDSSGAVDSSGSDSGAGAYDCSAMSNSNVSYTTTSSSETLIKRDATIRRPLADMLVNDPYTALYVCETISISPSTNEIWDMKTGGILTHLGLLEDDIVESVAGETDHLEIYDVIADEMINGGNFEVVIKRGSRVTLEYDVTVAPPT